MRERIEARLELLQAEFRAGQEMLADLENRQAGVRNTLVRISGAIQVLEELLQENNSPALNQEITTDAATTAIA
jgi:uncharacterized protein (UPF0147 family)